MAGMRKTRPDKTTAGYYLETKIIDALKRRANKNDRSDSAELSRILKRVLFKKAA